MFLSVLMPLKFVLKGYFHASLFLKFTNIFYSQEHEPIGGMFQ